MLVATEIVDEPTLAVRKPNGSRPAQALRQIHFWLGAILTLNFLLLVLTGLLIQHRDLFHLEDRTVSRKWLPAGYRPNDPDTAIRADIVIADLHSGRLFGPNGPLVIDLAAAGFLLMIASGFGMQLVCTCRNRFDPRRTAAAIALFVFLLFASAPASKAADVEVDGLRAQLRALMDRVALQEKELQDLKAQQAALLEKLEKTASSSQTVAPLSPPPEGAGNRLADHLRVGGYGSVRYETSDAGTGEGFTFRRFVLTTDAKISNRLRAYSEIEFERLWGIEVEKSAAATAGGLQLKQGVEGNSGGEIALEQAWGQYNIFENHGLRAGVILPPLGRFNILHDDDYWDLPRRTLVDRNAPVLPVKSAWRELGAGMVGAFNLGQTARLDYQFYVVNGATLDFNIESVAQTRNPRRSKLELGGEFGLLSGPFDGSRNARAFTWRTALSPSLAGEFALSGYHGRYTPDYLRISEPVNSLGFDYKWRRGGLEFEGEAIYSSFGRTRRVLDAFAATVYNSAVETTRDEAGRLESEVEFELTNLARTRYGFWTDFKYHWRPSWLKRTFLGKPFEDPRFIPILRYERVWLNRNVQELEVSNGAVTALETANLEQDRISLGFGYRPVRNFGIQAAFEHNRRINGAMLIFPRIGARSTNGFLSGLVFSF